MGFLRADGVQKFEDVINEIGYEIADVRLGSIAVTDHVNCIHMKTCGQRQDVFDVGLRMSAHAVKQNEGLPAARMEGPGPNASRIKIADFSSEHLQPCARKHFLFLPD